MEEGIHHCKYRSYFALYKLFERRAGLIFITFFRTVRRFHYYSGYFFMVFLQRSLWSCLLTRDFRLGHCTVQDNLWTIWLCGRYGSGFPRLNFKYQWWHSNQMPNGGVTTSRQYPRQLWCDHTLRCLGYYGAERKRGRMRSGFILMHLLAFFGDESAVYRNLAERGFDENSRVFESRLLPSHQE